jgi:hypothetical protein
VWKLTQSKGIHNIFNRAITENFPNLKKERVTQIQEAYRTLKPSGSKKKQSLDIS